MMLRRSLSGVLGQLVNEGLLPEERLPAAKAAAAEASSATPWFVRVLVGIGAWVSAAVLLVLVALTGVFDGQGSVLALGLVLYMVGFVLRHVASSDYPVQLALAAGLAGAVMLVVAFSLENGDTTQAVMATLLVSLVTVPIFPDVVMRFLATCAGSAALVLAFHELHLGPDGAVALVAVAAGLAWHLEARLLGNAWTRPLQRPVAWGLVVSLLAFQLSTVLDFGDELRVGPAASLSVAAALLVMVVAVAREMDAKLTSEPVLIALGATALLGWVMLHSAGVLAALYVAGLAFHRRSPVMLGLALVFLVGFLERFYQTMEMSLLVRSLVLLGSGALLLGLREYLRRRFGPIVLEELP